MIPGWLFWPIALFVVVAALQVVQLQNIFHAGLCLVLTFGGVAALYVMLGAHFIAAVQVLIYVGAIAVILMFAVMLTHHIAHEESDVPLGRRVGAFLLCGGFAWLGLLAVQTYPFVRNRYFQYVTIDQIGKQFLNKSAFLLPFELVAVLLLIALVGAVMVAWREDRKA